MSNLRLTDIGQASAVTSDSLIHIVNTGDTTQYSGGSSYKASLSQVFNSLSGYCVPDLYVSNIHACSPLFINPLNEGNVYFGSTSAVTVDLSNNRVGIGTTSPTSKLHIKGTDATSSNFSFKADDSTSTPLLYVRNDGSVGVGTSNMFGNSGQGLFVSNQLYGNGFTSLSSFRFGNNSLVGTLDGTGFSSVINGLQSLDVSGSDSGNPHRITARASTTGEIIRTYLNDGTTPALFVKNSGDVGIGISSPTSKLHINNTGVTDSILVEDSTNPDSTPFVIDSGGTMFVGETSSNWDGFSSAQFAKNGYILQRYGPGGYKLNDQSNSGGLWGIQSPSTDKLTVERFGIGSPMMIFDSNVFRIGAFTSSPTAQLHVRNTTFTDAFRIENQYGADVIVDFSGRTGIGIASPTSNLDISGVTGYSQLRIRTSFTPTSSGDTSGNIGDIAWDNNYFYVKTNTGWGRSTLDYSF